MLNFTYSIPTTIYFGESEIKKLANAIKQYSNRVLLLFGGGSIKKIGLYQNVVQILDENEIYFEELGGVKPNPSISSVREGINIMRQNNLDFVLAVGGGSVIDCAKAIAAGVYYEGDAWDFPMRKARVTKTANVGSILTLAATGSEMNGGAVISNEEFQLKLPMGDPKLRPKFSILDPKYTFSLPRNQTIAGVADIMSHLFEQYFSPTKNTIVQDRMTEALLKTCIECGPIAADNPENYEARANLMWASSLALNNMLSYGKIGDWATHMIEHELSAIFDITHGLGLAILTPHWMRHVLNENNVDKFVQYGKEVWNLNENTKIETANKAIELTADFFKKLGFVTKLSEVGIEENKLEEMAEKAVQFGKIGSFKKLDKNDVLDILKSAF